MSRCWDRGASLLSAALGVVAIAGVVMAEDKSAARNGRSVSAERSMPLEVAVEGPTAFESRQHHIGLTNWLLEETPVEVTDSAVRAQLSPEDIRSIEFPEVINGEPLKVGLVIPLDTAVQVNGLASSKNGTRGGVAREEGGVLSRTPDGGYVWALEVGSDGAGAIRLHVEKMSLPDNAELYFYSPAGEAYGPFTGVGPDGTGDMWTPSVFGSQGVLQLRLHGPVDERQLKDVSLSVTEIGHISRGVFGRPDEGGVASFCQYNASCIQNTNCVNEAAVSNAENAVAKMLWVKGCCIYTCSGGLIADTDTGTQIPYFLTANHCLSTSSTNLEAFFHYQVSCGTSSCTGTFTDPPSNLISGKTVGATIMATGSAGDFSLFQLTQNPPAGSVFLGWNNSAIAFTDGAELHRISHPSGAPQSYSHGTVDTSAPTCQGWPRGNRIYSRDDIGGTEGGSSGSPIVNAAGEIVGQLTGACGFNLNDVCDHASNATVDGAFAFYFSSVEPFLDPGGGCVPSAEVCNDGIDNDCDNLTDCNDPDCSGSPSCSCLPVGSACVNNSDCCSNKCRGPAGNKTCR